MSNLAPALAMLELCSIAQGMLAHDALLKKSYAKVLWARVYNPGKFVILLQGGEEEVKESLQAARVIAGDFEIDYVYLPYAHQNILAVLNQDQINHLQTTLESPSVGILECYSLSATLRAADAILKEAAVQAVALRLDPTLGGKGCFIFTAGLEDVQAGLAKGKKQAGFAFFYNAQEIARPHTELALTLDSDYPSPQIKS
jgi:microcompartment protein CcmL/EutN